MKGDLKWKKQLLLKEELMAIPSLWPLIMSLGPSRGILLTQTATDTYIVRPQAEGSTIPVARSASHLGIHPLIFVMDALMHTS